MDAAATKQGIAVFNKKKEEEQPAALYGASAKKEEVKTMAMAGSGIMNSNQANGTKYYNQGSTNQVPTVTGVGPNGMGSTQKYSQPVDGYASMNNKRGTDFKKSA